MILEKLTSAIAALMLITASATAQTAREDFKRDRNLAGSNHRAYPMPTQKLTPSPKGYEPVYLSHYGRHGSRYHIGATYTTTDTLLQHAKALGVLTPLGLEVAEKVHMLRDEAAGRDGELTELGALQHRQIADRMYHNFPEIFSKPVHIDAKSTIVIRCILSMENALQQLKALNPQLDIRHDASEHDMYYMNQPDKHLDKLKYQHGDEIDKFRKAHTHPERLMSTLFNDDSYWKTRIDANSLMHNLFGLTNNLQSSELAKKISMWNIFTDDEVYDLWTTSNVYWYIAFGPSKLSGGEQPYSQRNLLRKIISEADSCLALDHPTANLRYGHDTMVMPLTVLLELDGYNKQIDDLETLADNWSDYTIFPMGCNIQIVFYKNPSDPSAPVLLKVLRNENEAHLPLATDNFPYYRWEDFRRYFTEKLDRYDASRAK